MRSNVGVRELRNQTSAVLRRAQNGETITVTDRGVPVALLVPVAGSTVARSASKRLATTAAAEGLAAP